jgi:hypothetical protein
LCDGKRRGGGKPHCTPNQEAGSVGDWGKDAGQGLNAAVCVRCKPVQPPGHPPAIVPIPLWVRLPLLLLRLLLLRLLLLRLRRLVVRLIPEAGGGHARRAAGRVDEPAHAPAAGSHAGRLGIHVVPKRAACMHVLSSQHVRSLWALGGPGTPWAQAPQSWGPAPWLLHKGWHGSQPSPGLRKRTADLRRERPAGGLGGALRQQLGGQHLLLHIFEQGVQQPHEEAEACPDRDLRAQEEGVSEHP